MSTEPHYAIVVWWSEEDGLWLARAPDLEGCVTHGSTREAALANAADAIEGWLEAAYANDLPIPEPRYRPAIYAERFAA